MDDSTARGHRSLKSSSLQSCHPPRAVTRSILVIPWGIVHKSSHPPKLHLSAPSSTNAGVRWCRHPIAPSSTGAVIHQHSHPLAPLSPGAVIPWRRHSLASSFPGVVIHWCRCPLSPPSSGSILPATVILDLSSQHLSWIVIIPPLRRLQSS